MSNAQTKIFILHFILLATVSSLCATKNSPKSRSLGIIKKDLSPKNRKSVQFTEQVCTVPAETKDCALEEKYFSAYDEKGYTPIQAAVFGKNPNVLEKLLTQAHELNILEQVLTAQVHISSKDYPCNVLHLTARYGKIKELQCILAVADNAHLINQVLFNGYTRPLKESYTSQPSFDKPWTELHEAATHGHASIVQALIECALKNNSPFPDIQTAIEAADQKGFCPVLAIFEKFGLALSCDNIEPHQICVIL